MSNAVLTAALGYAAKGLPVFPVNPRTKKPYLQTPKGSKGGFHQATTDTKQIEDWWRQYPDAMIGVPTGERSGFWISDEDIDQKKGIDGCAELAKLIAQNGPLPPTRVCITPRGGRHHHWQVVGQAKLIRNSASKIAPGTTFAALAAMQSFHQASAPTARLIDGRAARISASPPIGSSKPRSKPAGQHKQGAQPFARSPH